MQNSKKPFKKKHEETSDRPIKTNQTKAKFKFNIFNFITRKKTEEKKGKIEYFKTKIKKKEKKRAHIQERRLKFKFYLEKSGLGLTSEILSKKLFILCVIINLGISAFLIYYFSVNSAISWTTILLSIATLWTLIFILLLFTFWIMFYLIVDLKIFRRKVDIEEVLPDYLQLTASNIKSGMTIDRALWYAVRPKFGVLAKEIEIVAKETMRGEDLKTALQKFADKYDSILLKRTISLLIEGLYSGGEIGNLLNKIAINIQENEITKKETAANLTTYIIFISFATIVAAPVLFALSGVLIQVLASLGSNLADVSGGGSTLSAISFSGSGIKHTDFRIFAIVSLITTSFFSAIIIATIKTGSAKTGLKFIPIFILVSLGIFLIAGAVIGSLVGILL